MKLINLLSGSMPFGPCVVGIGTFDGVHIGHQSLISSMIQRAKELSLPSVIFTFDHPPKRILNPENFPGEINTPEEKFQLLLKAGVDWVVFRPFDPEFARTLPGDFIKNILVPCLQTRSVFVGFNFGFGKGREGNAAFLCNVLKSLDVECRVLPSVSFEGKTVSSSTIRSSILEGNIDLANRLLGREASFSGIVVHGDHRGRTMGFPTANLELEGSTKVIPPRGVYFCKVDVPIGTFSAIVNIGVRPTFDKHRPLMEAHLLDFNDDLYHQTIRVRFFRHMRHEIRFPDIAALKAQIQLDTEHARELTKIFPHAGKEEKEGKS